MPEARDPQPPASTRRPAGAEPRDELAGIDALIDRLLPALTAKLASTHLGELEVREGEWRIRLRRPAGLGWNGELRRATDRASVAAGAADRSSRAGQPGHDAHGHGRTASDTHRVQVPGGSNGTGLPTASGATAGTGLASAASIPGSAAHLRGAAPAHEDESRRVATSPAVGVFRPGSRAVVGARVREGDSLGSVDVLGVPEEVPAPTDGVVAELLVEGGTAVEYGQELVLVAIVAAAASAEAGR